MHIAGGAMMPGKGAESGNSAPRLQKVGSACVQPRCAAEKAVQQKLVRT